MDELAQTVLQVEEQFPETQKAVPRYAVGAATLLLVSTFIEDSLRIYSLWEYQHKFVEKAGGLGEFLSKTLLLCSFTIQMSSVMLLAPISASIKKSVCYMVLACVAAQPLMYGQLGNLVFVCMSIAQVGALMLLGSSLQESIRDTEGSREVPGDAALTKLIARLLLTVDFFVVYCVNLDESMKDSLINPSSIAALLLLIACMLVWVGFKTMLTATALAVAVGMDTLFRFPFWSVPKAHADNVQFHFFQSLSLVGGMLLLAVHGPGRLSLDHQDKST